ATDSRRTSRSWRSCWATATAQRTCFATACTSAPGFGSSLSRSPARKQQRVPSGWRTRTTLTQTDPAPSAGRAMSRRSQLILLAIGVGAFVLLVYQAGPAMLLHQIRDSGVVLVPVILVYALVYVFNSEAWRLVMHERPP